MRRGLERGEDGVLRCWWCAADPLYRDYHDREWGIPSAEDRRLFETLCLDGFQAGLSWLTILRKRENFRRAFADFEIERVARFDARSVERLLRDPGIVRNRGKIESTLRNARRAREIVDAFGSLGAYLWRFEPTPAERPRRLTRAAFVRMTESAASRALSRDLKQRGWSFVGPTSVYAFMQSVGMVNDHLDGCHERARVERARRGFARPTASGNAP